MTDKKQPEALRGAPPSAYSQEDHVFYTFWYGHMLNDLMQPPLAGVSHSTARYIWDAAIAHVAAQPAGAQQPGTAYAELPSYEHQRAIMEAERNASLDEYSRIVLLTSTESRIYERAFTNGWNRRASHGQAQALAAPQQEAPAMPSGWVSCTIEFDGSGPEEVAYGPKIMMDRLAKWLGKHFERTIAEKAAPQPLPASQGDALDAARLDWLLLHISGAEFRRIGVHYSGNARRADVDAARKQGANHD